MLRDHARELFLEKDFNCAETTLRLANEFYGLGLEEEDFRLVSGYGGGFGCGITCGILCSDIAAISKMVVTERAHATEGFKELCEEYVNCFREAMGHTDCAPLKEMYFDEEGGGRCIAAVEKAADLFETFVEEHQLRSR